MDAKMLYVSYLGRNNTLRNGWISEKELNDSNDSITAICDDAYGGACGQYTKKSTIIILERQKTAPLGRAYYRVYLAEKGERVGYYKYSSEAGLSMYKLVGDSYVNVTWRASEDVVENVKDIIV